MKLFIKIFFIICLFNAVMFACFLFLHITDEALSTIAVQQGYTFKYFCGFPLVLFNGDYPYFLNSSHMPDYGWLMILGNTILQTIAVMIIIRLIHCLKSKD